MEKIDYFKNDTFRLMLKAYKKFKNYALYDKTDLKAKKLISEFEYCNSENSEEVLENFHNKLFDIAKKVESGEILIDLTDNYPLDFIFTPKSTVESGNKIYINQVMLDIELKNQVSYYLIGFAWIIKYGGFLETTFGDKVYGNRLKDDFSLETIRQSYSTSTYKPYFKQFSLWRNNAIKKVVNLEDTDKIIVNLDIKNFYYNIRIDWEFIERYIALFSKVDTENCIIHKYVKKIISIYSNCFEEDKGLPIFFPPSKILSNWALMPFDRGFDNDAFLYYGRYVDDIVFVMESSVVDINEIIFENEILASKFKMKLNIDDLNSIISSYLIPLEDITIDDRNDLITLLNSVKSFDITLEYDCFYKDRSRIYHQIKEFIGDYDIDYLLRLITSSKRLVKYTIMDDDYEIQKEKLKVFKFNKDFDKNLAIEKLKSELESDTSDFNFLPDFDGNLNLNKLFTSLKGVLKFRDMEEINLNRYEFSKFIGQLSVDVEMYNKSYGFKKRYDKYVEFIVNVLQGNACLENRLQWEKIFNLFYKMKDYESIRLFHSNCIESIESIHIADEIPLYSLKQDLNRENLHKLICSNLIDFLSISLSSGVSVSYNLKLGINFDSDLAIKINKSNLSSFNNLLSPIDNYLTKFNSYSNYKLSLAPKFISYDDIQFFEITKTIYKSNVLDFSNIKYDELYRKFILINYFYNLDVEVPDIEYFRLDNITFKEINNNYCTRSDVKVEHNMDLFGDNSIEDYINEFKIGLTSIKIDECSLIENLKYQIKNPRKFTYSHKEISQLKELLNQSVKNKVNLLVFPETSINYPNLNLLKRKSKRHNMAIACGTKHVLVGGVALNISWMMLPFEKKFRTSNDFEVKIRSLLIVPRIKNIYSPLEEIMIDQLKINTPQKSYPTISWNRYYRFIWNDIKLTLYNCYEISNIHHRALFKGELDLFMAIEMNRDISYFSNIVESMVRDMYCYVAQVNIANYGDSRVSQPTNSYEMDLAKIKGGENSYIVVIQLEIDELRKAQAKTNYCVDKALISKYQEAESKCEEKATHKTSWKPVPGKY